MQVRTVVNDEMSSRSVWRRVRRAVKTSFSATYLQNLHSINQENVFISRWILKVMIDYAYYFLFDFMFRFLILNILSSAVKIKHSAASFLAAQPP